jgi:hypothetical protein
MWNSTTRSGSFGICLAAPVSPKRLRPNGTLHSSATNSERDSVVHNKRLIGFVLQNVHREPFGSILSSYTPPGRRRCRSMLKGQDSPHRQSGRVAGASHSPSAGGAFNPLDRAGCSTVLPHRDLLTVSGCHGSCHGSTPVTSDHLLLGLGPSAP